MELPYFSLLLYHFVSYNEMKNRCFNNVGLASKI